MMVSISGRGQYWENGYKWEKVPSRSDAVVGVAVVVVVVVAVVVWLSGISGRRSMKMGRATMYVKTGKATVGL